MASIGNVEKLDGCDLRKYSTNFIKFWKFHQCLEWLERERNNCNILMILKLIGINSTIFI
jgi:hypothetical protein